MADDPADKPRRKRGKKKGAPKTGGRQKGTRNRNSLSVLAALDKANVPLIEFLVTDIQCLEPHQRINEWYRLLRYCYPKLKSVEFLTAPPRTEPTGQDVDPAESAPTEDLKALLKDGSEKA